jgi:hypothetical protein
VLAGLGAAGALVFSGRVLAAPPTDRLCVIVAASSKQTTLSLAQLRRVFSNLATDDAGGNRFIPWNAPPKTPDRVLFDKRVLGMDPDGIARYWIDQRIRGLQAPRTSTTPDMTVRVVASLPGAVAYVRESRLTPAVKVLRVDGRLPADAGYVLLP